MAQVAVYRVGLTGGIASGKSTVADMFAALGVPVIDTDVIAREVVAPGTPGLEAVVAAFGPGILLPGGEIDRARLRSLVFDDRARREALEAILHPRILERMNALSAATGGPYQVLVIPLLMEAGLESHVDRVLVVDCPAAVQRKRLVARDGETAASAERILAAQIDRQSRLDRADDVLENTGTRHDLERRVLALHAAYLQLAAGLKLPRLKNGGVKGTG